MAAGEVFTGRLGKILSRGVVVFDGAMGTLLQSEGLPAGLCPDAWCLENPKAVARAHKQYVEAGAHVIETNTFGATPVRLSHYGLADRVSDINWAAVRIAREAAGDRALVAGSIGPLGVLMEPLGAFTFDRAYEQYAKQVEALAAADPDILIIETVADLNEMRAAILACKDLAPQIPLIAQMTVDLRGRSYTGTSPESAALVMQSMGADAIGLNCSVGPDILVGAIERIAQVARVPVSVQPNAGLPRLVEGKTVFPMGPEEFASYGPRLVAAGASIVGGCCGTTPDHIRLLRKAVEGLKAPAPVIGSFSVCCAETPEKKEVFGGNPGVSPCVSRECGRKGGYSKERPEILRVLGRTAGEKGGIRKGELASEVTASSRPAASLSRELGLTSRTQALFFTESRLPIIIGERINPTGRKALSRDIKEGVFELVRREAKRQVAAGAQVLDVNVGVPLIDEPAAMKRAVEVVQEVTTVPVSIDSASPEAIEAGLRAFVGKALINSVTAEESKAATVFALARRYGAAVIGLTMDEDGLPSTAEDRVKIARRLLDMAASYGIPPWDVLIDPLALTAGAQQSQASETLRSISMIKSLGCRTSLGVSNVSFGLPNRPFLNAVYLNMALANGLDVAIVNPTDERIVDTVRAVRVFLHRDLDSREFIESVGPKKLAHTENEVLAKVGADSVAARVGSVVTGQRRSGGDASASPEVVTNPARRESPEFREPLGRSLFEAVLEGDKDGIVSLLERALAEEMDPMLILNEYLIPAITETGRLFADGVYFLPQLMLSATAMKNAFGRLKPEITKRSQGMPDRGAVILATVQGDVHDIGKNIVSILLENHGFKVVDLGRDVPAEDILREARRARADAVCLSALMTTTMPRMKEVIDLFAREGFACPVLVGGAATTKAFAREIGASGYGRDAQEAVSEVLRIVSSRGTR